MNFLGVEIRNTSDISIGIEDFESLILNENYRQIIKSCFLTNTFDIKQNLITPEKNIKISPYKLFLNYIASGKIAFTKDAWKFLEYATCCIVSSEEGVSEINFINKFICNLILACLEFKIGNNDIDQENLAKIIEYLLKKITHEDYIKRILIKCDGHQKLQGVKLIVLRRGAELCGGLFIFKNYKKTGKRKITENFVKKMRI